MCTLCQSLNPSLELTVHNVGEGPLITSFNTPTSTFGISTQNAALVETADAADGVSTSYSINGGDTFTGSVSSTDDADWIQIDLAAGEFLHAETVASLGGSLLGLNIYDAAGNLIHLNRAANWSKN